MRVIFDFSGEEDKGIVTSFMSSLAKNISEQKSNELTIAMQKELEEEKNIELTVKQASAYLKKYGIIKREYSVRRDIKLGLIKAEQGKKSYTIKKRDLDEYIKQTRNSF